MEQFMYTYLNQKYGLKTLIVDWASAILQAVKLFQNEDHDVTLFQKILSNECDEEFRFIQQHVKDMMLQQLKNLLKEKYPFKSEAEIAKLNDQIINGQISIEEGVWRKILEKMYDANDSEVMLQRLQTIVEQKK